MYTLTVENKRGHRITLSGIESDYQIVSIDGLNPPNAVLLSTNVAGMDGSRYTSSKLEERNIVLTIKINGDVERNRLNLYNYFKSKQYCKIYYSNLSRSVYAEGYIETIECNLFENGQTMQISIVCNDPYFNDIQEIAYDLAQIIGQFEFPFAFGGAGVLETTDTDDAIEFSIVEENRVVNIVNTGDTDCGFIIELTAKGEATNPTIYCVDTNESFGINCSLILGDVLRINSISGEKSVTLIRNGVESNYLKHIRRYSKWLKLQQGDNQFTYTADTNADLLVPVFKYRSKYEAV